MKSIWSIAWTNKSGGQNGVFVNSREKAIFLFLKIRKINHSAELTMFPAESVGIVRIFGGQNG